jgi:hypothetical protein
MGHWGYYDNDNDNCCDQWAYLVDYLYNAISKDAKNNKNNLNKVKNVTIGNMEYTILDNLKRNPQVVYGIIVKYMKKNFDKYSDCIPGICLTILEKLTKDNEPLSLPKNFSHELCDMAINSINHSIKYPESGWRDVDKRLEAQYHELSLFSQYMTCGNILDKIHY